MGMQTFLARVDRDMSIGLDFSEFLVAISLISSKDPGRKTELFFCMYDVDRNGLIDKSEMRCLIEVLMSETMPCATESSCLSLLVDLRVAGHRHARFIEDRS